MGGSPYPVLILMLLVGLALFGIGSMLVRSANRSEPSEEPITQLEASTPPPLPPHIYAWTHAFVEDDQPLSAEMRIDMIERLALVGQGWCESILRIIVVEEREPSVLAAAKHALAAFNTSADPG